jgi:microcystin-dependent protein
MSTLKVNEMRHLSNTGTANVVLESNATTNLQATSTLGLTVNGTLTVSGVATFNGNMVVGNASTDTVTLTSTVSGSANYSGFTGEIRMYAGNAAGDDPPDGWLYCNGDTINQTNSTTPDHHNSDGTGNDYLALYNLLKASSDWGNTSSWVWGTNNVKVPDFRSRSPVGVHTGASSSITAGLTSRTLSDTVGTETHTMVEAEMPSHTHTMTCANGDTGVTATLPNHVHTMAHTHSIAHNHGSSGSHSHTITYGHDEVGHGYVTDSDDGYGVLMTGNSTVDLDNFTGNSGGVSTANTGNPTSNPAVTINENGGHNHTVTAAVTPSSTANAHTILSPIIAVHYIIKV